MKKLRNFQPRCSTPVMWPLKIFENHTFLKKLMCFNKVEIDMFQFRHFIIPKNYCQAIFAVSSVSQTIIKLYM